MHQGKEDHILIRIPLLPSMPRKLEAETASLIARPQIYLLVLLLV